MLRVGVGLCVAVFHATFPWLKIEVLRSTSAVVHAIAHAGAFTTAATAATTAPATTTRATRLARCARRTVRATRRCLHRGRGRLAGIHWNRILDRRPRCRGGRLLAARALLTGRFAIRSRTAFAISRPRTVSFPVSLRTFARRIALTVTLTVTLGVAGTICSSPLTSTTAGTTSLAVAIMVASAIAAVPTPAVATITIAAASLLSATAITGGALRPCSFRRRFDHGGFRRAFAEQ